MSKYCPFKDTDNGCISDCALFNENAKSCFLVNIGYLADIFESLEGFKKGRKKEIQKFIVFVDNDSEHWWMDDYLNALLDDYMESLK